MRRTRRAKFKSNRLSPEEALVKAFCVMVMMMLMMMITRTRQRRVAINNAMR